MTNLKKTKSKKLVIPSVSKGKDPAKVNYKTANGKSDDLNLWDKLPREVVLNIFNRLQQSDLFRLATVCKSWRDLIHTTPHFWRTMHLKLSCAHKSMHSKRALWWSNILGGHFKELWISCHHEHAAQGCKSVVNDFQKVILNLLHLSLTSLKITDLQLHSTWNHLVLGTRYVMTRLLPSLDRLQYFQMSSANWPVREGFKVMDTILTVSRGTLQSLVIDGFFDTATLTKRPAEFERVTNGILSLNRLTKLGIDYQLLTDSFVTALSRSHTGQLKVLKILARHMDRNTPRISKNSWLTLIKACPTLKVAFNIDGLNSYITIVDILDPVLPIYKIRLMLKSSLEPSEWDGICTSAVLGLITINFRHSLVKFEMEVGRRSCLIDLAFIMLVKSCHQLMDVKTWAHFTYPTTATTVRAILQERRWQHNRRIFQENASKRTKLNPEDKAGPSTANATSQEGLSEE
ncbi:F-box only protein 39-like [Physella acuta]|uniref:F-box only protein 39-like n=1 Tax=Physella acuta TaxID=109671 RepID=UPI0027DE1E0D|nr:F-box only protein 39-like [Physella acuta]XP_059173864.1 F-box only protein 39-like [Physella acuta]